MEVRRIRYCPFCQSDIEAEVEFLEDCVVQKCPECGEEVGRAGAFIVGLAPVGVSLKIKVVVK